MIYYRVIKNKMKKLLLLILFPLTALSGMAQGLSANDIIKKADDARRGSTSYNEATMTVVRPKWQRSYSMKSWSKGEDLSLVKITAPAKDAGQGNLKIGNDIWSWMPSIDRLIKLSASVMGQSWMGSDFTNDDMVRQVSIVDDYTQKMLSGEKIREYDCWVIELVPHENTPVVWSRSIMWIDKGTFGIVKTENYDEDGILVQEINCFDLKKYGARVMPSLMEVIPVTEDGKKTILELIKAEFDQPISDSFFSQQKLKTIR